MTDFSFQKSVRIRKRPQILALRTQGQKLYSKHFLIVCAKNSLAESRLAVTITKKIDKRAVVRNRIRRHVRECFRLNRLSLAEEYDIHVIARSGAETLSSKEIHGELLRAFARARMLAKP